MHVGVTRHVVRLINESAQRGGKETIRPGRMNGDIVEKRIPLCARTMKAAKTTDTSTYKIF